MRRVYWLLGLIAWRLGRRYLARRFQAKRVARL
jgi:hypothetical protein